MAGKPPPTPRAAPRSSANETAGDSRAAAASEWETPPVRAGVRLEVKLAVLLIVTLSGAFGYLVHRKFDALRQQAAAAEGGEPEKFVPLAKGAKVAGEIDLSPPPPQTHSDEAAYAPTLPSGVAPASATTPTAAAPPPPLQSTPSDPQGEIDPASAQERQNLPVAAHPAGSPPPQTEPSAPRDPVESELLGLFGRGGGETSGRGIGSEQTPQTGRAPAMTAGDRSASSPRERGPVSEEPLAFPEHIPTANSSGPATSLSDTASPPAKGPNSTPPTLLPLDREAGWTSRQEAAVSAAESAPTPLPRPEEPFEPTLDPAPFEPAQRPSLLPAATEPTVPASTFPPVTESPSQSAEPLPFSAESSTPRTAVDPQPRPVERTSPDGDPFQLFAPSTPPAAATAVPARDNTPSSPSESTSQSPPPIFPQAVADPFPGPASPEPSAPAPLPPEQPQFPSEPRGFDSATAPPRHRLLDEIDTSPRPPAVPGPFPEVRPQPVPQGAFEPGPFTESAVRREGSPRFGDLYPASGMRIRTDRDLPGGELRTPPRLYTVRPGDSYWTISRIQYGTGRYHAALLEFNRASLPEAERIHPGMQLQIPPVELLESRYPELVQGTTNPSTTSSANSPAAADETGRFFISAEGQPMYRVGKGDTLTSIAQRHLGRASRWEQIARMNPDLVPHPDRLQVGVTLRLPHDASQVAASPSP